MSGALAAALAALALGAGAGARDEPRAVVWAVGDGADGSDQGRRLARRIAADDPDAFLYLGDVYDSGTAAEYASKYARAFGRLAPITWPTPGNHEWGNRAQGYLPYWRPWGRQSTAYSLRMGGWELVGLNSEASHDEGAPQLRRLRNMLSEPGNCRLAFWHRPRYSAGTVHGDAPDVEPFWRALAGRARLVVNGHEHNLQRFRRRRGITQYVAGSGGAILYALEKDPRLAFARSNRTGALRIVLSPGQAVLEFRDLGGALLDRSRVSCDAPVGGNPARHPLRGGTPAGS